MRAGQWGLAVRFQQRAMRVVREESATLALQAIRGEPLQKLVNDIQ
ncbi:MAG: hypothetical protein ACLQVF_05555 [Isosphaeraceae bacterium]